MDICIFPSDLESHTYENGENILGLKQNGTLLVETSTE